MHKKFFIWVSLIFFLLLLLNCRLVQAINLRSGQEQDSIKLPSTETPAELPIFTEFECVNPTQSFQIARVVKVIDGDSIVVKIDNHLFEVRYIGINTPEYKSNERAAAIAATRVNESLLFGKEVFLFRDVSETDKFGRLLRYVFTDEVFVNLELVKSGLAESRAYPPDTSCQALFNQ